MRLAAVIASVAVGAVAVVSWKLLSTRTQEDPAGARAATRLAEGLDRAMAAAEDLDEPYRCARLPPGGERGPGGEEVEPGERLVGRFVVRERGMRLELDRVAAAKARAKHRAKARAKARAEHRAEPLILGVVADARGHARHLDAVRRAFEAAGVDVVFSLGGLGQSQTEIAAVLDGLAGPWPLIAIPGDWEAIVAHRAAVAALAGRGVVDGARLRLIDAGAVWLATFPGAPHVERAMAGTQGCVHTEDDAVALADLFTAARPAAGKNGQAPHVRVVLSHVPPRQHGPRATDQVAEGIHIGEPALAEALARSGAQLAIHGLVVAPGPATGKRALDSRGGQEGPGDVVVLSAGALDGIAEVAHRGEVPPLALIVTVTPAQSEPGVVRWRAIRAPGTPKTRPARLE